MGGWYWIGLSQLKGGKVNQAITSFQAQVKGYPQQPQTAEAIYSLGMIYFQRGKIKDALAQYQLLLKGFPQSPSSAEALFQIGICYLKLNEGERAKGHFQRIIEQNQGQAVAYRARLEMGKILIDEGKFSLGLEQFQQVVKDRSDELAAQAQYQIGLTYSQKGDLDKAVVERLKVKYLYPGYPDWAVRALFEASSLYEKEGKWTQAKKVYLSILKGNYGEKTKEKAKARLDSIKGR